MNTLLSVIAVLVSLVSSEPRAADLSPTVERMEAAVLAGDGVGFLVEVDRADAVFFTEQTNWAKDLAEHKPLEFDIELDEGGFRAWEDGTVTVPMTMVWKLDEKGKQHRVGFTGRFVERDSAWRYAGETWLRVEAPGVVVLADPAFRDEAVHIAAILPSVRARVHELLGVTVEADQQVKVYASMAHLQQSIYLSYVEPLGGWNEPGEAIKMTGNEGASGRSLRQMLAHEYGHCATFAMGPKATEMPWWVLEGVAEFCSSEQAGGPGRMRRQVARWARSDELRTWEQLADFRGEAMNHMAYVYGQGHSMVRFVVETYGIDGLRGWLRSLAGGASLDEASRAELGTAWDEIDAAWRHSLDAAD